MIADELDKKLYGEAIQSLYITNINNDERLQIKLYFGYGIPNKSISYPKHLMQRKLGRLLLPTEQVHHKDRDFKHNDDDNLELIDIVEHGKLHNKKATPVQISCAFCGNIYYERPCRIKPHKKNFCTKTCASRSFNLGRTTSTSIKRAVIDK